MTDHTGNLLLNLPAHLREKMIGKVSPGSFAFIVEAVRSGLLTKTDAISLIQSML